MEVRVPGALREESVLGAAGEDAEAFVRIVRGVLLERDGRVDDRDALRGSRVMLSGTPSSRSNTTRRGALFRASSASLADLSNIPVAAMLSLTASWSLPPSVVNSFWYSTRSSAVFEASMAAPPLASAGEKTRSARSAAPRAPA